jgi:hypothetical protein
MGLSIAGPSGIVAAEVLVVVVAVEDFVADRWCCNVAVIAAVFVHNEFVVGKYATVVVIYTDWQIECLGLGFLLLKKGVVALALLLL